MRRKINLSYSGVAYASCQIQKSDSKNTARLISTPNCPQSVRVDKWRATPTPPRAALGGNQAKIAPDQLHSQ